MSQRVASSDVHRLRILVVEDEMLMRWSLAETLGAAGHEVREAADGESALAALTAVPAVDAVLLDCWLPDGNDLSLLARIRTLAPTTPVIVITAHGTPGLTSAARNMGAYAVLDKPFDLQDVARMVAGACGATPLESAKPVI
jgi:DNA-binding NtrC family response regulator